MLCVKESEIEICFSKDIRVSKCAQSLPICLAETLDVPDHFQVWAPVSSLFLSISVGSAVLCDFAAFIVDCRRLSAATLLLDISRLVSFKLQLSLSKLNNERETN